MKKLKYLGVLLLIPFILNGCSNLMVKAPSPEVKPPSEGKATIVFMRSSFVAGAIGADLFEVNNGQLSYIGVLANGTKIAYETSPGEKVFMAYGTAADFMKANVRAGKTYYVVARPNWGTGGFAPTPIRLDKSSQYNVHSKEFEDWYKDTDLVIAGPDVQNWFKENKTRMEEIYKTYWARFQTKSPGEVAERTLNPQDGR